MDIKPSRGVRPTISISATANSFVTAATNQTLIRDNNLATTSAAHPNPHCPEWSKLHFNDSYFQIQME